MKGLVSQYIRKIDTSTLQTKRRLRFFWILLSPLRFVRDKWLLRRKFRHIFSLSQFEISDSTGFTEVEVRQDLVAEIVENSMQLSKVRKDFNTKPYLQEISDLEDYSAQSAEFRLATSPEVIAFVTKYLGTFPYLYDITTLWSPSRDIIDSKTEEESGNFQGSQLWHRDGDDLRIAKLWILCSDVDEQAGPTVLLPADESEVVCQSIRYRQSSKIPQTQEKLLGINPQSTLKAVGPAGTVYFTDTDRLLHYGSRTSSGTERLVLMIHYVSFYSCYFRSIAPFGKVHKLNPRIAEDFHLLNPIQRALLRAYN